MAHLIFLTLILLLIAVIWFMTGSTTDINKVRKQANKHLGAVLPGQQYCALHKISAQELQQKIDCMELKAYSAGKFLFIQVTKCKAESHVDGKRLGH
jgi:hypothetical protein